MTNKQRSTRAVTTDQAGEQMSMPDRLRAKGGYNGGAAESTRAFLEAARASRNLQKRKRRRMNRGEAFGFGPTTLRPQCTIPLSQRLPLFYSFKKGAVFLINFLPTESNYLGFPFVPNSLLYTKRGAHT